MSFKQRHAKTMHETRESLPLVYTWCLFMSLLSHESSDMKTQRIK